MTTRAVTRKLLELADEGLIDKDTLIKACLGYMSEAEVADMAWSNGFVGDDDEEEAE